jgi:hypothetical protein
MGVSLYLLNTRAHLTAQFCKRPCFHDEYLPAFNKPNVTLVHTDGRGVERFTPNGIVADGIEYVGNMVY